MRLWSLHPQYLDPKGLVALWREGLLAQAVLSGQTRGYRHHPQLARFEECSSPRSQIAGYLLEIHAEAVRRGYRFNREKIGRVGKVQRIPVTRGQLEYEWEHLRAKLKSRAPSIYRGLKDITMPKPHPLFRVVAGGIAEWEFVATRQSIPARVPNGT
jgi:hypothetical protein